MFVISFVGVFVVTVKFKRTVSAQTGAISAGVYPQIKKYPNSRNTSRGTRPKAALENRCWQRGNAPVNQKAPQRA